MWTNISLETYKKIKKAGKPIVVERVNCYTGKAKRILDDAYMRLGIHPQHPITPDMIQREEAEVGIADFIFCPSPEVAKSFQESGVSEEKIMLTSYGWSPQRFPNTLSQCKQSEAITILFVGTICVRKGAHLLLRAWERSGIEGKLMLCGTMETAIAETCKEILARSDVIHRKYNPDMSVAYRNADFFAFPTLEEGSPLVTYEAMAHGLPALVSQMGAGSIVRDSIEGIVISPYDEDAWVEALRNLANSPELRTRLGSAARQRAEEFTWEKVAQRRAALIVDKLTKKPKV